MEKFLGSISDLSRLPAALFIIDTVKEHIAVAEAHKLNIPTFAITDTNTDPTQVDFAIPANDDASKSIAVIVESMIKAIEEGLSERKVDKELEKEKEMEEGGEEKEMSLEFSDDDSSSEKPAAPAKPNARPRRGNTAGGPRKK